MNKFKVGERIRIYSGNKVVCDTVVSVHGDLINVNEFIDLIHYKQCRRLRKKKDKLATPLENYDFWVHEGLELQSTHAVGPIPLKFIAETIAAAIRAGRV